MVVELSTDEVRGVLAALDSLPAGIAVPEVDREDAERDRAEYLALRERFAALTT